MTSETQDLSAAIVEASGLGAWEAPETANHGLGVIAIRSRSPRGESERTVVASEQIPKTEDKQITGFRLDTKREIDDRAKVTVDYNKDEGAPEPRPKPSHSNTMYGSVPGSEDNKATPFQNYLENMYQTSATTNQYSGLALKVGGKATSKGAPARYNSQRLQDGGNQQQQVLATHIKRTAYGAKVS